MRVYSEAALLLAALILPLPPLAAAGDCIPCHREKSPAAVSQWEKSAHGRGGIGCEKCHGTDHEKMKRGGMSQAEYEAAKKKLLDDYLTRKKGEQ